MPTFDSHDAPDPSAPSERQAAASDLGAQNGDSGHGDFYQPRSRDAASDHQSVDYDSGSEAGGDVDPDDDIDPVPGGPRFTPDRLIAAGVAAVVVVVLGLFLFTFTGGGSSTAAPTTGASVAQTVSDASVSTTTTSAGPSGSATATSAGPSGSASVSAGTPGPSASPTEARKGAHPSGHPLPSVTVTGGPPRLHVTTGAPITNTTGTDSTLVQQLIAGNAEYFFHALGNGDQAAFCGFWDPTSLSAYLAEVGVSSCSQLDPDQLTTPAERGADPTFTVTDPEAVQVVRGHAFIPASAIHEIGGRPAPVRLLLTGGLWRVVLTPPAPTPSTSTPPPVPPTTTPQVSTTPQVTTVPPSPSAPRTAVLLPDAV